MTSHAVESLPLHVPSSQELAKVLEDGLKKNFKEASVGVVDCPDLTRPPWNLAAPGLGGSPRLLDIGGTGYLLPLADTTKLFDLGEMASLVGLPGAFVLGAGAGSSRVAGVNCEMMPNARLSSDASPGFNNTHIAKVSTKDGSPLLEKFDSVETGPLANVLACEGKPGKVFEIRAKCRTGPDNFVTCMRRTLAGYYDTRPVGMGGAFQMVTGKAYLHIMPAFSETPIVTKEDVDKWLQFYFMSAPLICLSELVSYDPGMDLRVEHTHCFSDHGEGGHYHYDTTPDLVEYHGYYTLAETVYRIDRPSKPQDFGKD